MSNQPPQVRLGSPAAISATEEALGYAMSWQAQDVDGRVDHYLWALDPASTDVVDASWKRTSESVVIIRFPRSTALGRAVPARVGGREGFHVFVVRAVDDQGAVSPSATVALFEDNVAPIVIIENPLPNQFFVPITGPNPTIQWRGEDTDGGITQYRYRLFSADNPDLPGVDFIDLVSANPDTLRALYGPSFSSWDAANPGTTSASFTGLTPDKLYIFAITAFDNDGAFDPIFTDGNLLKFAVTHNDTILGPRICVSMPFFLFCEVTGGAPDPPPIEFPADSEVPVTWFAEPLEGSQITGYRWVLDPEDPLRDKAHGTDPGGWTAWSLGNTSTTLGPFSGEAATQEHLFIIQTRDSNGLIGTLRLRLIPRRLSPERDLLVVDDTRLHLDQRDPLGNIAPPIGPWPTAAELDTFLYARGGYPWQGYPAGTLSAPGLFNGYDFDTLGTLRISGGIVPLTVLSRYRHVVWLTNDVGATYTGSPLDPVSPITSLRLMNGGGQFNTLAAYVQQGGKLWLLGGGAAYATLAWWNARNTPPDEFTAADGELIPGRFMYDYAHWRAGVMIRPATQALLNHEQVTTDPTALPGRGWPGQPAYSKLLTQAPMLLSRTCATDPPSPLRVCNSFYLPISFTGEGISRPTSILEDFDPRPNKQDLQSTLDTIYVSAGGTLTPRSPIMTYYHGRESAPLVFSGFPIWHFRRQQGAAVTDFVLQDIWGLPKQSSAVAARATRSRAR